MDPKTAKQTALEFLEAYNAFVAASRKLFVPQPDDRLLDQYLTLRDMVLALVSTEAFHAELKNAVMTPNFTWLVDPGLISILTEEMNAFSRSVEVGTAITDPAEKKSMWRRMFGRGSTTLGSVKDLIPDMPVLVKGGITVFKELFDLFKG